ncbi:HAD-IIIC family phosphatase, partial [Salmonella enterica subsp. enterica serovar Muenster]|nr:HAD-IIIC family phosphatase [Salmonella enterica subsp. enterica serovar Muenster]
MTNTVEAILFDLDNTLINTNSLQEYRESTNKQPLTDEQLSTTKLYPKTKTILDKLKQNNITLGIVTNSPRRYALDILEHHNIKDFFDTIVTYNEVGPDGIKPSPKGINLALSNLKLNSNN